MDRDRLQAVAIQLAVHDIVALHQEERVNDVAAIHIETGIRDGALTRTESAGPLPGNAAIAAKRQLHTMSLSPLDDVWQVEVKDVVAFDDIGIPLLHQRDEGLQERRFIQLRPRQNL